MRGGERDPPSTEIVKKMISRRIGKKVSRVFDLQTIFSRSSDDFNGRNACRVQLIHNFYRNVVLTSWDRGLSGSVNSLRTFSAYVIGVHLETTSTSQPAGVRLSFKVTFDGVPGAV